MKKEQNQFLENIIAFFLCFFMLFNTIVNPVEVFGAKPSNFIYWSTLKANAINLTTSNYASLSDMTTYGTNMSLSTYSGMTWDTTAHEIATRVTYQKAFYVTYNTTLSLLCATDGGYNQLHENRIAWNVLEWDTNGNLLFDSNWMKTTASYTVGVSTPAGYADYSGGTRVAKVAYVTLIFRYVENGDLGDSQGNLNITPTGLVNDLPNLYICSKPFTYTINNNGSISTVSRDKLTPITPLTDKSKTGYTFHGWKVTSNSSLSNNWMNGNTYSTSQLNTYMSNGKFYNSLFGNVTFTASFSPNTYTVVYNANGGTTSATSKTVTYGGTVDLSPTASRTGYTFIGWSTSRTARVPLSAYSMPASNVTLYAVYSIKVSDIQNHDYPTYTGTPNISNDEVFLKVWIKNTTNCRYFPLTYSQDTNTLVYRYSLPAASSSEIAGFVSGREFAYQLIAYDNAGNEGILYDGSGGTPIPPEPERYTQTVNHYKYHPLSNTQILFATSNTDVIEGTTFVPSYVTPPTGYHASSKDAGKTVVATNTFNAYYRPNTYTLTYDANGGKLTPASQTVTYDNYYPALPLPTRTGYTFLGWNTVSNGTGAMVKDGDVYTIDGNQTLYAQWKANVYEIKLDAQGATSLGTIAYYEKYNVGNFKTSDCANGISTITVPTKTGYTFGGYYTDKGGHGTQYVDASGNILSSPKTFSENRTLYAKWTANTYTVKYNANGGTGDMTALLVTYDTSVRLSSNLFDRTGYTFAGWSTTADGTVTYVDKQSIKNITATDGAVIDLYAVWNINSYTVTYDYWTNGGSSVELNNATIQYNAPVDLSVSAEKGNGFTFVGWNTDASATTGITSLSMGTENLTLYAIYEKTIQVTLVEKNGEDVIETILRKTIYNNASQADFFVEEKGMMPDWRNKGWSDKKEATAETVTSTGATYTTSDSISLYALYVSDVTVNYDTNGAGIEYDSVTMERFHNASGDTHYPLFKIERAPEFLNHSFAMWQALKGTMYDEADWVEIKESTVLTAVWDQFPSIEAYDRYFTLEQAQNGFITQMELLNKVIGKDREDGILANGSEVIVKDYNAKLFTEITEDTDVEIVYQAKDDFENVVTKQIIVGIRNTFLIEGKKTYVRFIGREFLEDEDGRLLSEEAGGLEKTSIWRRDDSYLSLLRKVLSKDVSEKVTIFFTADELKKIKEMSPAN